MAFAFPVTELTLRVGDTPLPHLGQQLPALDHQLPILPAIDVESLFSRKGNVKFQDREQPRTSELHARSRDLTRSANTSARERQQKADTGHRSRRNGSRSQRRMHRPKPRQDSASLAHNYGRGQDRFQTSRASGNQNRGTSIARIINSPANKQPNSETKLVSRVQRVGGSLIDRRGGGDSTIEVKSTEAKGTVAEKSSKLGHRSGQLPVDLPQQLLLTPVGPLEWRQMVSDSKTPHFLLVPATPVKATWMNDGDTAAPSPGSRAETKEQPPNKAQIGDNEALQTHSNQHQLASLQPTHVTSRIEIHNGAMHEIEPSIGIIKHFENHMRTGPEFTNSNSQFQNGNRGQDQNTFKGQIIFHNETPENKFSVIQMAGNNNGPQQRDTMQMFHNNNKPIDYHKTSPYFEIPFDHRPNDAELGNPDLIRIDNAFASVQKVPEIHEHKHGSTAVYLQPNPGAQKDIETDSYEVNVHSNIYSSSSNNHASTSLGNDENYLRRDSNSLWFKVSPQDMNSGVAFSRDNSASSSPIRKHKFGHHQDHGHYVEKVDWPGFLDNTEEKLLKSDLNNVKYGQIKQFSDFPENLGHGGTEIDRHGSNFHVSDRENDHRTPATYDQDIYVSGNTPKPREVNTSQQKHTWENDRSAHSSSGFHRDFGLNEKDVRIVSATPTHFTADAISHTGSVSLRENSSPAQIEVLSEVYSPSSPDHLPLERRFVSQETDTQRLQNPFGKLINKDIAHNKDLTTRYSKRIYSSTRHPTMSLQDMPTRTMIQHDGHTDELRKQNTNERETYLSASQHHPSSFHIQTFPHSSNFNGKPQSSNIRSVPKGTGHRSDKARESGFRPVKHDPVRYKFTELDVVTRPHKAPVTISQRDHRHRTTAANNYPYSLTSKPKQNDHLSKAFEDNFNRGRDHQEDSPGKVLQQSISSSGDPREQKLDAIEQEDIYESASNIDSSKLQNFQYDIPENANLFDAINLRSSQMPVTYIEYTTQKSATESRFVKKDSSGRPRFENNPFFMNFGPFPQLELKTEGEAENFSDKVVFVTPAPARVNMSDVMRRSQSTHSVDEHFEPMESARKQPNRVALLETNAGNEKNSEFSNDAEIRFNTSDRISSTRDSLNIFDKNGTVSVQDIDSAGNDVSELHTYENLDQLNFSRNNQNNLETEEGEPVVKNESHSPKNTSDRHASVEVLGESERLNLENKDSGLVSELRSGTKMDDSRRHRTGGALLDALVDMVKKASPDKESLHDMLPPFSVLEVGVGERLSGPALSAKAPHDYNHTLPFPTSPAPSSSAFSSMVQLGIALGVVILVAVLLFHAPRLRRELCSKEKRERLRRLKQRYSQDTISSSSSSSSAELNSTSYKFPLDGGEKNIIAGGRDEKSDGESHYARVLDVKL